MKSICDQRRFHSRVSPVRPNRPLDEGPQVVDGTCKHRVGRTTSRRPATTGGRRAAGDEADRRETDAVYSRYHIARGRDLRAGVARVADYIESLNGSVQESGKEATTAVRVQKTGSRK